MGDTPSLMQEAAMRMIASMLILAFAGALAAAAPPQDSPAAASGSPAQGSPKSMNFRFEDTPIDLILNEMAQRLDVIIEKKDPLPTRVTIYVPEKIDAEQAVGLINSILLSVKYAAVEVHREGEPKRILRVMPFDQAKKEVPMTVR
jgi:hypothetical protein